MRFDWSCDLETTGPSSTSFSNRWVNSESMALRGVGTGYVCS